MVARKSWRFGIKALSGIGALAVTASLLANANPAAATSSEISSAPKVAAAETVTRSATEVTYPEIFGDVIQDSSAPKIPTFKRESSTRDLDTYSIQWTAAKPPEKMVITGYTVRYMDLRGITNSEFQYYMSVGRSPDWSACSDIDGSPTNTTARCELGIGSQPIFLVQALFGPAPGSTGTGKASHPAFAVDTRFKQLIDDRNFSLNSTRNEVISRVRVLLAEAHQQGIGELGKKSILKEGGLLAVAIHLMSNAVVTRDLDGLAAVVAAAQIKAPTQRAQISRITTAPGNSERTTEITAHFSQPLGDLFAIPMTVTLACSSRGGVYTGTSSLTTNSQSALARSVSVAVPYGDYRCGMYGNNAQGSAPTSIWPSTVIARGPKALPDASSISYVWNANGTLTASWADPEPANDYANTSVKAVAAGTDRKVNVDRGGLPAIECANRNCEVTLVMGAAQWSPSELLLARDSRSGGEKATYTIPGRFVTSVMERDGDSTNAEDTSSSVGNALQITWKIDTSNTLNTSGTSYLVGYRELRGEATELDVMSNDTAFTSSKTLNSYTACVSEIPNTDGIAQAKCAGLSPEKDYSVRVFVLNSDGSLVASSGTLIIKGIKPSEPIDTVWYENIRDTFSFSNFLSTMEFQWTHCGNYAIICIIFAIAIAVSVGVLTAVIANIISSYINKERVRLTAPKLVPIKQDNGKYWTIDKNGNLVADIGIDVNEVWSESARKALERIQSGSDEADWIDVDQKYFIKCGLNDEKTYTAQEIYDAGGVHRHYLSGYGPETCAVKMTYTVKAKWARDVTLETKTSELTFEVGQLPPPVSNVSATPVISGDAERALNVEFTPGTINQEQRMASGFIIEAVPQGENANKYEAVTYKTPATYYQYSEPGAPIPATSHVLGGDDGEGTLRGGVTYLVTVRAYNSLGKSEVGVSSAVITMPNRAPEMVQLSAVQYPIDSRAVLSWSFKDALNGSPVKSQQINCATPDSAFNLSTNRRITFNVPVVAGRSDYTLTLDFGQGKNLVFGERYTCSLFMETEEGFTSTSIQPVSVMLEELLPAIGVPTQNRFANIFRPVRWQVPAQYDGRLEWVIEYLSNGQWVRWRPGYGQSLHIHPNMFIYLWFSPIPKDTTMRVYVITQSGRYSVPRQFVAR